MRALVNKLKGVLSTAFERWHEALMDSHEAGVKVKSVNEARSFWYWKLRIHRHSLLRQKRAKILNRSIDHGIILCLEVSQSSHRNMAQVERQSYKLLLPSLDLAS